MAAVGSAGAGCEEDQATAAAASSGCNWILTFLAWPFEAITAAARKAAEANGAMLLRAMDLCNRLARCCCGGGFPGIARSGASSRCKEDLEKLTQFATPCEPRIRAADCRLKVDFG